jgi:hypothetical protein
MSIDDAVAIYLSVLGVTLLVTVILVVVGYLLMALALSSLFARTGVEQWKAWVPVYNNWTLLRLSGQPGYWVLFSLVGLGIVSSVFLCIGMYRIGIGFRKDGAFTVLGVFLAPVWAFMLGYGRQPWEPELLAYAGYDRPTVGFGAAPAYTPYATGYTSPPAQNFERPAPPA